MKGPTEHDTFYRYNERSLQLGGSRDNKENPIPVGFWSHDFWDIILIIIRPKFTWYAYQVISYREYVVCKKWYGS